MTRFPDLPIYTGFNEPSRIEADVHDLEVEGEVPREIDGSFYRVAPDPQYPPLLGKDIYFNGDGMIARFCFKDGKVDFRSRYARTDKFELERAAGKSLFGAYRNPLSDDPAVQGRVRGTANTNVLVHAGQLLALKEDSPALAMDPETLETKGYWDFGGTLDCPTFTAHPKLDPKTGEMVAFGYAAKGLTTPDIDVFTIDAAGRVKRKVSIVAPYYSMVHDFAVTRDYVVFPIVPIVGSFDRLKAGLPHFGWDSSKDIHIGILPRDGEAKDVRWLRGHNRFASHVMNGFNDGRKVYLDMPVAEGNMFPFFPDVTGAPFSPARAASRLSRWTVDLSSNSNTFEETRLSEAVGEFPRIDDRYAMEPYRHGFMAVQDNTKPFTLKGGSITGMHFNSLAHVDHATGATETYFVGPTSGFQEPVFIPRSADAPEGDGYVAAIVSRYEEMRSDLVLLDAQRIAAGPLATIRLPLRMRTGLHGNWVPAQRAA